MISFQLKLKAIAMCLIIINGVIEMKKISIIFVNYSGEGRTPFLNKKMAKKMSLRKIKKAQASREKLIGLKNINFFQYVGALK